MFDFDDGHARLRALFPDVDPRRRRARPPASSCASTWSTACSPRRPTAELAALRAVDPLGVRRARVRPGRAAARRSREAARRAVRPRGGSRWSAPRTGPGRSARCWRRNLADFPGELVRGAGRGVAARRARADRPGRGRGAGAGRARGRRRRGGRRGRGDGGAVRRVRRDRAGGCGAAGGASSRGPPRSGARRRAELLRVAELRPAAERLDRHRPTQRGRRDLVRQPVRRLRHGDLRPGRRRPGPLRQDLRPGNTADVTIAELLAELVDDPASRTLCFLLESVRDGRAFVEHARRADAAQAGDRGQDRALRRPGARAAASHTAALAASEARVAGSVPAGRDRRGALRVRSCSTSARALDGQPLPPATGSRIITNSGGTGVELADLLADEGLTVPALSACAAGADPGTCSRPTRARRIPST